MVSVVVVVVVLLLLLLLLLLTGPDDFVLFFAVVESEYQPEREVLGEGVLHSALRSIKELALYKQLLARERPASLACRRSIRRLRRLWPRHIRRGARLRHLSARGERCLVAALAL